MAPTQKKFGEKMECNREDFLCRLLEDGGKCLENEVTAFQKKIYSFKLE
jgi:hypothetical protein